MKRWYDVEIRRLVVNGKNETTRRHTDHVVVYGTEQTAVGLAFRRANDPFEDEDRRRETFVDVVPLPDDHDLLGRPMFQQVAPVEDGSAFGLSVTDVAALTGGEISAVVN